MDGDAVESNAGEVFPREAWMGAFAHYPRFLPLPATKERGEGRGEGFLWNRTLLLSKRPSSPKPSPPAAGGEEVHSAWFGAVPVCARHGSWPMKLLSMDHRKHYVSLRMPLGMLML